MIALAQDPAPDVRLQVAIAAGKLEALDPLETLLDVQKSSYNDPLIPRIVWQNLLPLIEERQTELARRLEESKGKAPGLSSLIPRTIERLLESNKADARVVARLLSSSADEEITTEAIDLVLDRFRDHSLPAPLETALRREMNAAIKSMFGAPDHHINDFLTIAQAYCGDQESLKNAVLWARSNQVREGERAEHEERRIRAVQAVLYRRVQGIVPTLVAAILAENDSSSSVAFRAKVLDSLSSVDDPELAPAVLENYAGLPAEMKSRAVELLTQRPAWTKALLHAVAAKQIPTSVLNVTQLRKLQKSRDATIAGQVKTLWGTVRDRRDPKRERVSTEIRGMLKKTPGDPVAGQAVFKKICAQCHKIYGEGQDVGPELTSNGRNDFEQLVSNVFDPSLVIGPGYQATTVATTEGRILTGLLIEDGNERVMLKLQGGQVETIQRSQVDELKTSEMSLMPDSFESQISTQEIADLCAFLCLDKPPSDPTAKALPGSGPMIRPRK